MGLRVSDVINEQIKTLEKEHSEHLRDIDPIRETGFDLRSSQIRNQIKSLKALRTKLRRLKLIQ